MKERPIIFSAESVKAIMAGVKVQTRRVVKLPPAPANLGEWKPSTIGGEGVFDRKLAAVPEEACIWHTRTGACLACPQGKPGDRLWVREAWCYYGAGDAFVGYRATDEDRISEDARGPWRSPLYLPREYARLLLEVCSVRVERLQEISRADCIAEGIGSEWDRIYGTTGHGKQRAFASAWDRLNDKRDKGAYSWCMNPWVWCITFRRVPQAGATAPAADSK